MIGVSVQEAPLDTFVSVYQRNTSGWMLAATHSRVCADATCLSADARVQLRLLCIDYLSCDSAAFSPQSSSLAQTRAAEHQLDVSVKTECVAAQYFLPISDVSHP